MPALQIGANKVVSLTYSIHDDHGKILEHSDVPIHYVHGENGDMFEKLQATLAGKTIGDQVSVTLSPEEGYGPHNPDLTFTDELENVPEELRFVGAELGVKSADGGMMKFIVSEIKDNEITVDANHLLAGKTVIFKAKVTDIRDASSGEIRSGQPDANDPGRSLQ